MFVNGKNLALQGHLRARSRHLVLIKVSENLFKKLTIICVRLLRINGFFEFYPNFFCKDLKVLSDIADSKGKPRYQVEVASSFFETVSFFLR
ncbi:hypothetical protein Cyrtocomes_01067 [Candidatus Cyrtobacter comes]|uniref:Uncharacterized protein n=1 Tax=Candidatus Cyrtobacter comes TaxID=675776 RepID=A0ABU5L971_9RICK|nr:hypothetical protein [Candidatus Cyrtobacter comes]